jgi:two-component system chemotaxis response regulator CheY
MSRQEALILICDDEPDLRELMRLSLDTVPRYNFVEAADGSEAIALLGSARPDLLLLDVMMPGTSGIAVLEHLRADPELSETPVIVVSAFASPADRDRAIQAGATRFVKKPFDPDALRSLVEELLPSRPEE